MGIRFSSEYGIKLYFMEKVNRNSNTKQFVDSEWESVSFRTLLGF